MLPTTVTALKAICAADPTLPAGVIGDCLRILSGTGLVAEKPDEAISYSEAARRLGGLSSQTIYKYIRLGKLRAVGVGRRRTRIAASSVAALLAGVA